MPTNLFSHPSSRGNIVQFRAGLLKKEGNLVTADPRKGYVQVTDDGGALVVRWIDRTTQVTEDVAHLYPGQATISRVEKCTTGRVYVIKFLDCDREEFFWFQEPSEDKDQEWIDSIKKKLCGDNEPSGRLSTRMHLDRTRNPNGHTSRPQANDLQLLQQLLFQGSDGSHSQMQQELLELLSGSSGIGLSSSTTSSPSPNLTSVSQGVVNREEPVSPQIGTTTGVSTSALTVDTCLTQLIASREVREAIQENPLRYVAAVAETLPTRPREDGSDLIRHLRNPQVQDTASLLQEALRDPEGYSEICAAFNVSINRSSGVSSVRSFLEALCDENTEKAPETD